MTTKIDSKDRKIINELWRDARQTDSSIAKRVSLSREVVRYRIKRLERLGAIKDYITLVDTGKLGYVTFHVYVRLNDFDQEKFDEIIHHIKENKYIKWLITISGQYDLFFVIMARSRRELDSHLAELYNKFDEHVSETRILSTIKIYKDVEFLYPNAKPYLKTQYKETVETQPETDKVIVNDIDYEILRIISKNARMNVVEIARCLRKKKIELTAEAVSYRMKKLQQQQIIRGYRVVLNFKKLGYLWYLLLINLRRIPLEFEPKLIESFKQDPKVIYADKTLGDWNVRMELLVKDHEEFHSDLIKIRNLVSEYLNVYDLMVIFDDHMMVSFTEGIYRDRFGK